MRTSFAIDFQLVNGPIVEANMLANVKIGGITVIRVTEAKTSGTTGRISFLQIKRIRLASIAHWTVNVRLTDTLSGLIVAVCFADTTMIAFTVDTFRKVPETGIAPVASTTADIRSTIALSVG